MKKSSLILWSFLLMTHFGFSQYLKKDEVPENVKAEFHTKYPSVDKMTWEKEDGGYEAEFKWNGVKQSTLFNNEGQFILLETEVKSKDLPSAVKALLAKDFGMYKIEESSKIEMANGDILYEIELKQEELELLITESGTLVSKTKVAENKEK